MSAALDVCAQLSLSSGSETIAVAAEHSRIRIDVEQLDTAVNLVKRELSQGRWREHLHRLQAGLYAAGLDVHIHLVGKPIARLGTHARPGLTSRLLGLGSIELHPFHLGLTWWQRNRQ